MSDYKRNIVSDLYLAVNEFEGENYVHLRKFFKDRDGNLKAKKEGIAILLVSSLYSSIRWNISNLVSGQWRRDCQ